MVEKAFCKSINSGFGRSIKCRNGKSITKIKNYATKEEVGQGRLPPGHWLVTMGNGDVWGSLLFSAAGILDTKQQVLH